MNYSRAFIDAIEQASKSENLYLGTGNPNAKILIVGKELGFDSNDRCQNDKEIVQNIVQWRENVNNNISPLDITEHTHNPLFPYFGMTLSSQKAGHTWRKYQKLHDNIFSNSVKSDECYTFHNDFFLTELNQEPSKYNRQQNVMKRRQSILSRADFIASSAFFQNFPIVVFACGSYAQNQGISIEKLFNVKWAQPTRGEHKQWYNLHYSDCGKILIHTRQLSMDVKNDLLLNIAQEIMQFLKV